MFAAGYFAKTYFTGSYFAPNDSGSIIDETFYAWRPLFIPRRR